MRVTKAIREYIEQQVSLKANQSESIVELKKKADDEEPRFKNDVEVIQNECRKKMQDIADKYGIQNSYSRYLTVNDGYLLPGNIRYREARDELLKKKNLAITEILATMELGGTKAELMEMIDKLTF